MYKRALSRDQAERQKCSNGPTMTCTVTTPIGDMHVVTCSHGLHALGQEGRISDENFSADAGREVKIIEKKEPDSGYTKDAVNQCIDWLKLYFSDPHATQMLALPHICVASETGTFRERVWAVLAKNVGPGRTVSYADLARMVNVPGANQAVGSAMASNPVQLIVPCHRVIKSDGTLGNYHKGCRNKVKRWLLKHEGTENIK